MHGKPTTASILSLIGGILVLLIGTYWAFLAAIGLWLLSSGANASSDFLTGPWVLWILLFYIHLLAPFVFGILIVYGATKMMGNPDSAKTCGIVILIPGMFLFLGETVIPTLLRGVISGSFGMTFDFFYVTTTLGGLLATIGGALALTWKPDNKSGFTF
jgi:hypothetical protein